MFLKRQDHRIGLIGGIILAGLTLAAGISVYVVMQRQAEAMLGKNLEASLQSNVRLFEGRIDQALSNTQTVASRPYLIKNLQLLASKQGNATGLIALQSAAQSFLLPSFTGLSIYDVGGHELARAGELSQKHDLRVPLNTKHRAFLLWDEHFILHSSMDILDQQGRRIGMVTTEAKLRQMTAAFANIASIGKTGEFAVCALLADDEKNMDCFLSRISGKVINPLARVVEGKPLPMNYALNGETGIIFAKDYRREQVIAAYAPVGALGLGIVLKIDQAELYQPVIEQLKFIAPLLAALVMVGMLLLNFLVRPLVRKLVDSERAARDANALLRDSEARFTNIVNLAADAIISVDEEQRILIFNQGAERIFGYAAAEILGQALDKLLPERFADTHHPYVRQFTTESTARDMNWRPEISGRRKDGTEFPAEANLSRALENGKFIFTVHLCDISLRKQTEDKILHLNRVYAMLSGINTLIVRVRDRDTLFREACRIAVEAGGFRMALVGIVDRSTLKISPAASAGKDEELLTAIKGILSSSEGAPTTMVTRAIKEKKAVVSNDSQSDPQVLFGKKYTESGVRSMAVFPLIVADEAVGVLALYAAEIQFFDEEEMKLLTELAGDIAFAIDHIDKQERLNYLAYYDDLTGLANRTLFLERVAQYMRSAVSGAHKLAVFLIDLERFRNINDSLGRPAGDALLKQVAQWLSLSAGDANLVARVGADQFSTVLPVVKQGDGARSLEKTIEAFLVHPFRLNDGVFRIAVKVGVAIFPDDGADADTLFRNAEAALKNAKASGDRYLFYMQKMTQFVVGKLTLENQLRQALDNEEFVLHYQPKVNLASGKLTGAEALIRWNDSRTGLVPSGHFIPILEETGLIHEVGRWALRQAIADYLRWRAAGLPAVRIAVNVSPLQLRHRGFIAEIEQAIGIDTQAAAGLELEITESVIMEDVKGSIASLQAIRALGISIAIDDFGTGFSSLSYLAKLPLDTLKIDCSFVIDMTAGSQGLALVSTIINLAHSLKLKVVAEGVETEEQSRLLRLMGCDEMQGYLFSKPVPGEIFEAQFLVAPNAG